MLSTACSRVTGNLLHVYSCTLLYETGTRKQQKAGICVHGLANPWAMPWATAVSLSACCLLFAALQLLPCSAGCHITTTYNKHAYMFNDFKGP
jgi:hypothetical protein